MYGDIAKSKGLLMAKESLMARRLLRAKGPVLIVILGG